MKLKNKPTYTATDSRWTPSIKQVSDAEFVTAWMTSRTNAEVATKLGLTQSQTSSRATFLRNKGVKLPTKLNKTDPNSIDALNKLVKKYTRG